jgi:hypothetical protein
VIQVPPRPEANFIQQHQGRIKRVNRRPLKTGHWVLGAGIAIVILAAFLPWATLGPFTISGMKGDGQITLVLGLVMAGLGARHFVAPGKGTLIPGLIVASLVTLTGLIDAGEVPELAEPGVGLLLTILAGIATIVGFAMVAGDRLSAPVEDAPIWIPPAPKTHVDPVDALERWEKMSQH